MKNLFKNILTVLLTAIVIIPAYSQDIRTLDTKVVDILAQFPAESNQHADKLMKEIVDLGADGIAKFCEMIVPAGTGDDTQTRFALASLAQYAGVKEGKTRNTVEESLLAALAKTSDKEEQNFFIDRLAYCGGSSTIAAMKVFLTDKELYSAALGTLTMIGTEEAAKLIFSNIQEASDDIEFVKALGVLQYEPAESYLISKATSSNHKLLKQIYATLARIGEAKSAKTLKKAVEDAGYVIDDTEAIVAYLDYAKQLSTNGNKTLSNKLANSLLKKCENEDQLIYRSSALQILRKNKGADAISLLLKEIKNNDKKYRNAVLQIAQEGITSNEVNQWVSTLNDVSPETQGEILHFLASRHEKAVLANAILPSLSSNDIIVRKEAMMALAINQKSKAVPIQTKQLANIKEKEEYKAIEKALLVSCSVKDCELLVTQLDNLNDAGKNVIVNVLAARRATEYFDEVQAQCTSANIELKASAFEALERVAKAEDLNKLINLLEASSEQSEIEAVQKAIANLYTKENRPDASVILNMIAAKSSQVKLIPLLPMLNSNSALKTVVSLLNEGSISEKEVAFNALSKWRDASALQTLFNVFSNKAQSVFREKALNAYVNQVQQSEIPADQKLLWLSKIMDECFLKAEEEKVIQATASVKTFLSLMFVSNYIDDEQLGSTAANSAMKIALPSAGKKDGLTGKEVRQILTKVKDKLSGTDSQYAIIDVQEYLNKMPSESGYVSIFNGKDLEGWQGLVENPIKRAEMSQEELIKAQIEANAKISENWSVKDGAIVFNGKGHNLCTEKMYKDFDMLVDWKINKDGDSGIYLRGSPQIQIWDTSRVDVGAQVGSGGLYNNQKHASKPLVLADNAIGDWNTFRIRMIDEKVTAYLNGQLVVDNVVMENYWKRSIPIFREGPIELQAHGNELAFRNIYVRKINPDKSTLTKEEKQEGFTSLFSGQNLDNWTGNKIDYTVEDGMIIVKPQKGSHGNLYTKKDYSNFIFRFEFQLTPGANNGLGIHAPLEGDAAYVGKELQILDNTAPIYADLKPYQYHGSVYGIIPAKRGFLNPVGEWNYQEVIVNGNDIKITLNGQVIVDGNIKTATKDGTLDHKDHPGLNRHSGRIGFLGHGSELKFRNIRIKEL